jgi:hypothetical protein
MLSGVVVVCSISVEWSILEAEPLQGLGGLHIIAVDAG